VFFALRTAHRERPAGNGQHFEDNFRIPELLSIGLHFGRCCRLAIGIAQVGILGIRFARASRRSEAGTTGDEDRRNSRKMICYHGRRWAVPTWMRELWMRERA